MAFSSQSSIQTLVKEIKKEMFMGKEDPYSSFIAPSAYDTAWLAMVPDPDKPSLPMFKNCLTWVLNSQKEEGLWGEYDGHGMPTIECLPATIACMIALNKWNVGEELIQKGLAFIEANAKKLLGGVYNSCPRWFVIAFPGMMELARINGLQIIYPDRVKPVVMEIFCKRQDILNREEVVEKYSYPPLLSYLEALPLYNVNPEVITQHLCMDGSLFQSPSATASAFMATGNKACLEYLQSLVQRFSAGVPAVYPIDEELTKLCMVNHIKRMGIAEHFNQEIEGVLEQVYRSYMKREHEGSEPVTSIAMAQQLYKDSMAFWLLRMHGYNVSPGHFCWFLNDEEMLQCIEENHEYFSSVMLNVYRATDLMFPGEHELEEARSFSVKSLQKTLLSTGTIDQTSSPFPNFHALIKHELRFPWITRLDHLEHRKWIEEKNLSALWMGKTSFQRLSSPCINKLKELAVQNYEFRQSIYRRELDELTRWSRRWGLTDIGFGREKTGYCYFAIAASTMLPHDSEIRLIVAKSAIIVTVADDFYDMEGSLDDLTNLTDAVSRWDCSGLEGYGKTIFVALESLLNEIAGKCLEQKGIDITENLRHIWKETFASWYTEAKWSRSDFIPSKEEYLKTGMTSIATHTISLPAACFLNPSLQSDKLSPTHYQTITKLLMIIPRLLNDTQSYEKEQEDGKKNFVLLHMKENPQADTEESVAHIRDMLDKMKQEFLEHALMDGFSDVSRPCRQLHLSCLKVFQMFFDSSNRYDSNTEMLHDIQKAIFAPIQIGEPEVPLKSLPRKSSGGPAKRYQTVAHYYQIDHPRIKPDFSIGRPPARSTISLTKSRSQHMNLLIAPKSRILFHMNNYRPLITSIIS
ncbi:hypothetical protein Tsubulata_019870 [Turnera subulata]|uniref:(+)-delta-cadinene synthase n=1 Tax=Turnera subulata TaxID=218843 RepID=A0A9Q0GGW3_9ROSI|nr:hypothetical protein Tsubulata_019870 [Turnera subulata]